MFFFDNSLRLLKCHRMFKKKKTLFFYDIFSNKYRVLAHKKKHLLVKSFWNLTFIAIYILLIVEIKIKVYLKLISWFFLRSSKSRLSFLGVQQYSFEEKFFFPHTWPSDKTRIVVWKNPFVGVVDINNIGTLQYTHLYTNLTLTLTHSTYGVIIIPPYAHVTYVSHHTPEPHDHGVYVYIQYICAGENGFSTFWNLIQLFH